MKAWKFLLAGPDLIQEGYDNASIAKYTVSYFANQRLQAEDGSFEVFTPENRYVFVSSEQDIKNIIAAPDTVLSLQAAAKQVAAPHSTKTLF